MSFLKMTAFASPFAQITNSTAPIVFNRFDTTSESWLSASGTNGYSSASSKMFISFQVVNPAGNEMWGVRLNGTTDKWKWGAVFGGTTQSRTANDEICIDYSQTTDYDSPSTHYDLVANPHHIETRFNCMRIELI